VSPADVTALLGAFIAIVGSILLPVYFAKHTARKEALRQAADVRAAEHSTDVVSWQAINLAISRERDNFRDRLTESEAKYYKQVEQAKMKSDEELTKLKSKYDALLAKATDKIEDLQKQVLALSALLARAEAGGKPRSTRDEP
jgi:hypothetical protein